MDTKWFDGFVRSLATNSTRRTSDPARGGRGTRGGAGRSRVPGEGRRPGVPGRWRNLPPGRPVLRWQVPQQRDLRAGRGRRHLRPGGTDRLPERRLRLHQNEHRRRAGQLHLPARHVRGLGCDATADCCDGFCLASRGICLRRAAAVHSRGGSMQQRPDPLLPGLQLRRWRLRGVGSVWRCPWSF